LAQAVAPVPVRLVDERMSTVTAHQALHASGRAGRNHRQVVDQAAAVVILQTALDAERSTGRRAGEPVEVDLPGGTSDQCVGGCGHGRTRPQDGAHDPHDGATDHGSEGRAGE
jgi:putative Holliday junction resolvase